MKPKLSIITASYNSSKSIKETINSVLHQTINDFEYIIIDGKSGDNTVEIIRSYEKEFKARGIDYKWISESDNGIYDAWNKGLLIAKGDWISFLGSDDSYCKDAIQTYSEEISNNELDSFDLIYSNVKVMDGDKHLKTIKGVWSWSIFKRHMNIAHVGAFHNKAFFIEQGIFNQCYKICGDYELLLRAKDKLKTKKIDKITCVMSYGGVSNSNVKCVFKEALKAKHDTGGLSKIICIYDYYTDFVKYYIRRLWYAINR
ncbi:glycosyltransferase family 2 protein [Flavivirga abyssicola]|uniref:glycosyltransferase family 2 protein n=1 Tax=Flavivirga abyssicola TaxID=3063533 RepID=UPI0026DEEB18|nr:glycosyltransferase family 2 protein [Flavivirga sp. MEBiC07777]WVK14792.1 glycosyltransferase family 2 protein [Flavivirga sp. MEBiC07777]